MTHEKLPFWRRLGYGMGDIYGGGASILISFYYLIFLVDVVRIGRTGYLHQQSLRLDHRPI
jgi:Na+/melibiose symporter-like transporter